MRTFLSSFAFVSFAFLIADGAQAAIPPKKAAVTGPSVVVRVTQEALDLPMSNRLQALQAQGAAGYQNLVRIMFDDRLAMETRWRATTAAARIGGEKSLPELRQALGRSEWFMRNAGLVAMSGVDQKAAIHWARELLSDKALVVRTAAVNALRELGDRESAGLLWRKLYAKENFRHGQSLFVRRHIVEALTALEPAGSEAKFVEILSDEDASLHPVAIAALRRLTNQHFDDTAPLPLQRERWLSWWKSHGNSEAKF